MTNEELAVATAAELQKSVVGAADVVKRFLALYERQVEATERLVMRVQEYVEMRRDGIIR